MTKDDIMQMAREAGVSAAQMLHVFGTEDALFDSDIQELRAVERLAQAAYTAGAAAERKACQKLCDDESLFRAKAALTHPEGSIQQDICSIAAQAARNCSDAIWARGKTLSREVDISEK